MARTKKAARKQPAQKRVKKGEEEVEETTDQQEEMDNETSTTSTTSTTEQSIPDVKVKGTQKRKISKDEDVEEEEEEEESTSTKTDSTESFDEPPVSKDQIKIISWNVAGFKSCAGKGFKSYIEQEKPDIVCLQETKILPANVPKTAIPEGYEIHINPCIAKTGNHGTGLLTKTKPLSISMGIGIEKHDQEGRVITAEFEKFYVVNSYVPNSGVDRTKPLARLDYRTKEWDVDFFNYMRNLNKTKPVIWCGDLNVAHNEIDLANPKTNKRTAGFTVEERTSFSGFLESGYVDTYRHYNPNKTGAYSFWSYMGGARAKNTGWRLDYFIVSAAFLGSIASTFMRTKVMGSDHCPIGIVVNKD